MIVGSCMMRCSIPATFALLLLTSAAAEPITVDDITVVDGDTVRWHGQSVRLVGFDAPETYRPRQSTGAEARRQTQLRESCCEKA